MMSIYRLLHITALRHYHLSACALECVILRLEMEKTRSQNVLHNSGGWGPGSNCCHGDLSFYSFLLFLTLLFHSSQFKSPLLIHILPLKPLLLIICCCQYLSTCISLFLSSYLAHPFFLCCWQSNLWHSSVMTHTPLKGKGCSCHYPSLFCPTVQHQNHLSGR